MNKYLFNPRKNFLSIKNNERNHKGNTDRTGQVQIKYIWGY